MQYLFRKEIREYELVLAVGFICKLLCFKFSYSNTKYHQNICVLDKKW
jgi:hypothetical protein